MSKPLVFAANWKLNKNPRETREFLRAFRSEATREVQSQCVFFVPATSLEAAGEALLGSGIGFGSQNCYSKASGAFTGEISAQVVKEMGGQFILVGHSERRQYFRESDVEISEKAAFVQSIDLVPVICIGETLYERESGLTTKVIEMQLTQALSRLDLSKSFIIAYEPVWAIGTGKVASIEQVAELHSFIRKKIGKTSVPILYGGSVKPDNAEQLIKIPDVNGFLVGGASLDVHSFLAISQARP